MEVKDTNKIDGQGTQMDTASRLLWSNNEFFAELFNRVVFQYSIIDANSLEDTSEAESVMLRLDNGRTGLKNFRDLAKRWKDGDVILAILAAENQSKRHFLMPFRCMRQDFINYARQISLIEAERGKDFRDNAPLEINRDMTDEEYYSHFLMTDRICPVITVVVYYGDEPWNWPLSLKDILSDTPAKKFANDYPMTLLDIKHMSQADLDAYSPKLQACLGFIHHSKGPQLGDFISDHKDVLSSLPMKTLDALLTITGSRNYFKDLSLDEVEEGGNDVCKGLELYVREKNMETAVMLLKDLGHSADYAAAYLQEEFGDSDGISPMDFIASHWDNPKISSKAPSASAPS